MKTDIFLRSYAGDIAWVPWALRSIHRFVNGIRDIIICVPANDYLQFKKLNLTRERVVSSKLDHMMDGYMAQQADKLRACFYCEDDTDQILFWDSDCVATRPFNPEDLMVLEKPRLLMTPYSKLVDESGKAATPWEAITSKAVGYPVEFEFMRAHPLLVPRFTLLAFRQFMVNLHGVSVDDYILGQPGREFSEWNALGAWAWNYAPSETFSFWNTETRGVPEPFVRQFWSWGGITPEIKDEMERLLA